MANVSTEAMRSITQLTVSRNLLDGVRTAFDLHKTHSQNCGTADGKDCDKMLADKAAADAEFRKFGEDMHAKVDRSQASLDGKTALVRALGGERASLPILKQSLKRELQLRSEDIEETEDLKYRLDDAVGRERRLEPIIKSF